MKSDLKIDSPYEILTRGISLMMKTDEKRQSEMKEVMKKVQKRLSEYYSKKMMPVMR